MSKFPAHRPSDSKSVLGRLAERIDFSGGPTACWPWLGTTNSVDQPVFSVSGMTNKVPRRIMWSLRHGLPVPEGHVVVPGPDCRNGLCTNPDHMACVTKSEAGRRRTPLRGVCKHGHDISPGSGNLRVRANASGKVIRTCRACDRERVASRRAERKPILAARRAERRASLEAGVEPPPPILTRTECRHGHDLTLPDATVENSDGYPVCRVCHVEWCRRWRESVRADA